MPRVTKAHMRQSIHPFAADAIKIIRKNFDLTDRINREDYEFEEDGWYYTIHKDVHFVEFIELRIKRQNFKPNQYRIKYQPKGNRLEETAWVYFENVSSGLHLDGFIINDYRKWSY